MEKFNTHGGYFAPQGYQKVTTGGSHEENPYGGIQMGVDPEGVPNLLEEGEPVYNDFVYSDNIKADAEMLKKYNLPTKYAGEPYSDVVNHFMDEAEERPGDAISNNGLRVMLGRLAQAQEEQKAIEEQEALEEELANLSPEELAELEDILAQQEAATPEIEAPVEETVPSEMALGGEINTFQPGGKKQNWFTRASLGAMMADTPAVATASGWTYDADGNIVQTDQDTEGAGALRQSLAELATVPLTEMTAGLIGPAYRMKMGTQSASDIVEKARSAKSQAVALAKTTKATDIAKETMKSAADSYTNAKTAATNAAEKMKKASDGLTAAVSKYDLNSKAVNNAVKKFAEAEVELSKAKGLVNKTWFSRLGAGAGKAATSAGQFVLNSVVPKVIGPTGVVAQEALPFYNLYLNSVPANSVEQEAVPVADNRFAFDDEPAAVISVAETSSPSAIDWDNLTHTYTKALGGKINKTDKGDNTVNVFRTGEYIRRAVPIMDPSLVVLPAGDIDWDSYYTPVEEEVVDDAAEIPAHFVDLDAYRVPVADEVVEDESLPGEQVSAERAASLPLLSTLPRYGGAFTSGLLGLYDMAQKPDRYRLPNYSPVLPSSRTAFVNSVYTPTDENIALNAVRSSGNTTINALRNSGLGPSTAAGLLAANNAIGKNIGSALTQVRESNDKERNAVIDRINANNQAASSLRFRTGMARAQIQNDAMLRNLQNNLTLQRLNNQAEGEKYAAISNQLDQTGQALSGIGRENMNLNMINSNPAYQYVILPNGEIGYLPTRSKGGTLLKKYKK